MRNDNQSLSHTKWNCKYHIVFAPKYRRQVPEMYEGYIIRPRWLPEGFSFSAGSRFTSVDSEVFSLDFVHGDKWLNLNINVVTSDNAVYSYEFERTLDIPIERTVNQYTVTFYRNAEDSLQSSFWINENAYYVLAGEISVDSILQFVEQME